MGAPNFGTPQGVSKLFAILPTQEEPMDEDWYWEEIQEGIIAELEGLGLDIASVREDRRKYVPYEPDAIYFGEGDDDIFNDDVHISYYTVMRAGYHAGAMLDVTWRFDICGRSYSEMPTVEWLKEDIAEGWIDDEYIPNPEYVIKHLHRKVDKIKEKIEEVYERHSTTLQVVARFSNGETFYAPM